MNTINWPVYDSGAVTNAAEKLRQLGERIGGSPAVGLGRFTLTHGGERGEVSLISNGDAERFGIETLSAAGTIAAVAIRLDGPRMDGEAPGERPYSPFIVVWKNGAGINDGFADTKPYLRDAQVALIRSIQAHLSA